MRTLFFVISFLATSIAYSQNVPQITVSKEKVNVNGAVMFVHKVQKGETLYSLSKAYNVTIDDIVRQNESLKSGLKEGTTIYIPSLAPASPISQNTVAQETATSPQEWELSGSNIKKYSKKKHKVKWYEKIGDIAVKYNVPQESIIAFNLLNSTELKTKQVIYIPNDDFLALYEKKQEKAPAAPAQKQVEQVQKVEIMEENGTDVQLPVLGKKGDITYILPLGLKDTLGPNPNFMDFYAGALLAADTLKNMGYNLTVNLIDQQMYNSVGGIMGSGAIAGKHYIIGPVKHSDLAAMIQTADKRTTFVSPMDISSGQLADQYNNFIQIAPSQDAQLKNLVDLVVSKNTLDNSIMVIYEKNGADGKMVGQVLELLNSKGVIYNKISYDILEGREVIDKIMDALEPGLENLVLVPSNSEAFVNDVVRNLNLLHTNPAKEKKRTITLFGTAKWRNFETIEADYFHTMNLHLSLPYYVNYNSSLVKDFIMKYRALYSSEPTPFAFQGFDITMMAFGLADMTTQCRYHFTREEKNTGIKNTGTINIMYERDYTITIIE